MDKILEQLATLGISAEQMNEIKQIFEASVDAKVQVKTDAIAKEYAKKAEEFCQKKIKEATEKHFAEIEEQANNWCAEMKKQLQEEANKKVAEYSKSLEEASEQYVFETLDKMCQEKYGEELQMIEEKVITGLDKYLEYTIKDKIGPKLIQKTALSEMYEPIIKGVQSLFEEQYIPLDKTGAKKVRELKSENAELQKTLKKQLSENLRLAEVAEVNSKKALIAEKTEGMTLRQKAKVQKFFESKTFSGTKSDIDNYVEMLDEQADQYRALQADRQRLFEKAQRAPRKSFSREDSTNFVNEGLKKQRVKSWSEEQLERTSRFCDED